MEHLCGTYATIRIECRGRDRYGRVLVTLWGNDKTNVNHLLVRNGVAHASVTYRPENIERARFLAEQEHDARRNKTGLWGIVNMDYLSPMELKTSPSLNAHRVTVKKEFQRYRRNYYRIKANKEVNISSLEIRLHNAKKRKRDSK